VQKNEKHGRDFIGQSPMSELIHDLFSATSPAPG